MLRKVVLSYHVSVGVYFPSCVLRRPSQIRDSGHLCTLSGMLAFFLCFQMTPG